MVDACDLESFEAATETQVLPGRMAPVDWTQVLQLTSQEIERLDGFLSSEYSLSEVNTGVTNVPVFAQVPSMLLCHLGRQEFTHADSLEELLASTRDALVRVAIVAGTPGCGKTRSLYDLFCKIDGLYFAVSTALSGGSNDLSWMIHALDRFLIPGDTTKANREVVGVFTMLLLACRMVIYRYCKSKGADSRQWLLLQAACRGIWPGEDIFATFLDRAMRNLPSDRDGIRSELRHLEHQLWELSPLPTVAIDEAQLAVQQLASSFFWSESRASWLPLVYPLVEYLQVGPSFFHRVLVTGTGYALHFKREALEGSGGPKMVSPLPKFVSFSGWDEPEQMVQFASRVLKLSENDVDLLSSKTWGIFPRFRGRFRPFCDVLQCMLLKQMNLAKASAYVIAAQTTKEGRGEFPSSFYLKVARVLATPVGNVVVTLGGELESAVVQYFGAGRGWTVTGSLQAEALQVGVARVVTDCYAAEIEEYLILLAARNVFEDCYEEQGGARADYLPEKLFHRICNWEYASAQGLGYQNLAAAAFEAMWKKGSGRMASMPLFQPLLQCRECPAGFWELAKLQGNLNEGMISVFVQSSRYTLDMYLSDLDQDRQMCTAFICEDDVVLRRVCYRLPDGTTKSINMSDRHKVPSSDAQMENAEMKSGISKLTSEVSGYQVRLLYIFPHSRRDWPAACWDGNVGTIVVDTENGSQVFGDKIANHFGKGGC